MEMGKNRFLQFLVKHFFLLGFVALLSLGPISEFTNDKLKDSRAFMATYIIVFIH